MRTVQGAGAQAVSDDADKFGKVLPFPSLRELQDTGGPVSRVPPKHYPCNHDVGITVDDHEREVTCKGCGKTIDAFEALLKLSTDWDWTRSLDAKRQLRAEVEALHKQIERLKANRTRLTREASISVATVRKVFKDVGAKLVRMAHHARGGDDKAAAQAYDYAAYQLRAYADRFGSDDGESSE